MINSRNEILKLLDEYIDTQQEYVHQYWTSDSQEWSGKRQAAYYNGIVLGKLREEDTLTLQVLKEGVTNKALYDEIRINLEYCIKMIEEMEQPNIIYKKRLESYKKQKDELSCNSINNWICKNCRWIQEDVEGKTCSEIRALLYLYYSFDNYNYEMKDPFCSDLNKLEVYKDIVES